jgi:general secretion pathway protein D
MSRFNRLAAILLAAALAGPTAHLDGKTRKGNAYFAEGAKYEEKKEWDEALASYEKALAEDPSDVSYRIGAEKARVAASQAHLENGLKLRSKGQLNEALVEIQRASGLNPASTASAQEILRTQEMIERERLRVQETGIEAPAAIRALTPAEAAQQQVREKIDRMMPLPELRPLNAERINLKMNNQPPKVLFETVAKVAGINVIWDPEYQPGRNLSLDLSNSTLEEALDDIAILTKSFWKPLPGGNTIFVTNDNRNKRNDYEDQVLKVFYLSNVNTPQELQEIVNAVRAVTELTRLMPYNSLHAIIARGEADRVALAEKIINDLDRPKAEVVIDVMVMQASSVFSRQITAAVASTGLNIPANFAPRTSLQVVQNTSTTNSSTTNNNTTLTNTGTTSNTTAQTSGPLSIPLSNLQHLGTADWAITLPGALLQAALSDANTKILQSPEVRSVDNSKASLKIGERQPTATGSFQPGIGGVGINPLVNTQFTYIDVGVNVDITPQVHENDEVSMHVELDISSVAGYVNLGGIQQPIIQQNKVIHDLRVREGDVSLLAGLSQDQESKTVTGIPGLSSIPVIGKLFSGQSIDRNKSELMIALVPHIVRRPDISPENLKAVGVGNATSVKLNYAPRNGLVAAARPAAPAGSAVATPPAGAAGAALAPNPGPPAPAANITPPAPAANIAPSAPAANAASPAAPANRPVGSAAIFFQPPQVDATVSSTFSVAVAVVGAKDAVGAPMQIQFDPKILRLNDITLGDLMTQGGQQPVLTKNILNDAGAATVQLARPAGSPGASGDGVLVTLNFQVVGRGSTSITIPNMSIFNPQGQPTLSGSPQLTVNIK